MRDLSAGPRVLLKRLRELMAEPLEPQERLDRIVRQIANNMVAEVCSVYVLRSDGVLELYATEGLNKDAVHLAQLKMGQGLVGTIAASAQSLNLSDAQAHPAFRYLPETGEEIYHSFLGVPILRAGRSLGVLVVQNKAQRNYREDELEALETTAMVIAEMIATGELKKITRPGLELDLTRPVSIDGDSYSEGIGLGYVVLHEPRIVVTNLLNEDSETEIRRLATALGSLRISIDDMLSRREISMEGEHRDVLETYRMFAHDQGWVRRMEEAIHNGLTAEAAVEKVQSDTKARMMRLTDPYLRERMHDFDDLANRLLRQLTGFSPHSAAEGFPNDAIVFARAMGAAELLDYPRANLRGLVLEEGAVTSHVVIVARAMGIAVVGQAAGAVALAENGDPVIIDGDDGKVHVRPVADLQKAYEEKVKLRAKRQEQFRALRDVEPVTKDGHRIKLQMNAGLLVDLPQLADSGADGIGLFRTELQFMISSTMPKGEEQESFYRNVLKQAAGRPVTFRTLDIGGDKVVPYFRSQEEENPALGWRAIRLSLDRPGLLRTQLRALLKAASGAELKMMLPMVTEVSEIRAVRELMQKEIQHISKFGHQLPKKLQFGAMLEVPALLWQLDELMDEVDFVSVGSNDLFQFAMAVDRGNARVSDRFDVLGRPFLRILRDIVRAGERNKTPVTLCGEMASKPLPAMALLGIGFRSISMSPTAIGPVKAMLLGLDVGLLSEVLMAALDDDTPGVSVRDLLLRHAEEHNIPV
ncbi:MAG: phosphoenolpyruvate--protein phosphotransferase [Alphaproteobacteria bacterium]|jgi:phosphotransferase system enzyme I (PtsP)|uniref:phosphoenolpyruvate--protein phosphotransferase n=1 Tax=Rhizobium/Agrobacterium group TaxID=227290 RepID=UPI0006B97008|nr:MULTISPECIES: phosphoenolpyruvate--protein phosphotransferase [Rhizobium/Agrobacterium group]MBU0738857.1 phosphoenolpyruvate--protein phosphotransferase [Alphaproteobacteria bacterium]MDZ7873283.1 phosphoenolpyruvate--protein phosphotransferase [Rhizobium sp.]AOG10616.1 phosphoenolpyruvate-protein phosphotransferase [Agrobacterium sp. RAC06]KPF57853.1 peptidase [Rhizobium sp. AAP116]MBU0831051.1 phosphoenolpyruvate--protein phosphotransferase [Alphaproteobacteria bacterium]